MIKRMIHCTSLLINLLALSIAVAQAQTTNSRPNGAGSLASDKSEFQFSVLLAQVRRSSHSAFSLMPSSTGVRPTAPLFNIVPAASGPSLPVVGGGTPGRLTKWSGFTSTNSFIGDTTIFEDKTGLVGIGTDIPTSRLTVAGTIQSLSGGFKFPDGSIQMTAFSPSQVVTSLNGLTGNVLLAAGENITITPAGNMLTIASSNSLTSIAHDATLTGNGTIGSPLGVAVPLNLTKAVPANGSLIDAIIRATNTAEGGRGITAIGGNGNDMIGSGEGMRATGGDASGGISAPNIGGRGVVADGGKGIDGADGGTGLLAVGGSADNSGVGGEGADVIGGSGDSGGTGIVAHGGQNTSGGLRGSAGVFDGNVEVIGHLSKSSGSFKIDHPLDPENKYLYHSFVESPDMMNIYNGVVKLDLRGEAAVELPEWFGALNRDFRYLLTAIGAPGPNLYIAEKIASNRFRIAGGQPGMEVSWQVTGIRHDAYANLHRIPVEEDKPERERGTYLHPDAFNQPEEHSVEWARNPELMEQIKQRRIEAEQKIKQQQQ